MDISFCIVSLNSIKLLKKCLDSIPCSVKGYSYEVIVADNYSYDNTVGILKKLYPEVRLITNKEIIDAVEEDINEIYHKDPACNYLFQPLLFYKGFQALQAHRVANYWTKEKLGFSMYIQSIVSEKFNVDIHPSAEIGKGIMIDHASGVVIGETARVGDYCSIFHGVTLGGVGAEKGQRHPQVGKNVLLSANSTIVGNIKIGDNTKIGAGSVVLNDIPKDCTAVGVPAKIINN